ncbi:molybdenum cofactor biosynthesis protein MoaE [Fictibacillus aquaticus]|uniref:Molybdopterin synthase catalytic subunit n=1 Tax=Fictibacillus aquaticus TaxID=2021314 RepID=A0A235F4Q0_9BACL|nr:molybdenum cofactor biosynthesis protein MoaE [Fictibacillus aquaticus]OYD56188.1 molybdenum cofactor biosynthesis protein MoaE [Fictibacillus aquaticus]
MKDTLYRVTDQPISVEDVMAKVIRPEAGAVTNFIGTVREFTKGKRTLYLKYEAYPSMAEKQLARIGKEIQEKWPEARTAITHRIGRLDISEIAVVIAVSTPHRKDAYAANEYAIERIKQIVPIWKKEHYENGEEWIGDQLETVSYPSGKPEGEEFHD